MRPPACAPLQDELAAALRAAAVFPGATLCCAFSGGVDSSVLLHGLAALRGTFGFRLEAAHVHHGLSPHADAWATHCMAVCAALAVPLRVFRVEVERGAPDGLEAAARRARHAVLGSLACDWLVFGHHQDDQAETLLFRLLRGTGVRGAAAMAEHEAGRPGVLRPLFGVRRERIESAARAAGLAWVEDESNARLAHARNRLRHRVLPVLEAAFPAAVPALVRAAENFREADGLLDELAALDEATCGGRVLRLEAVLALPSARLRNLLRWQVRRFGVLPPVRARLLEVERQLREAAVQAPLRMAFGDLACCAYRGRLWLEPAETAAPQACAWRGEPVLPWGDGEVLLRPAEGLGLSAAALQGAASVRLRCRWPGLAMRLEAGRPRRAFKQLCQEAGVPPWLRGRLPVLEADGEAVWIGGIGCAGAWRAGHGEAGVEPLWRSG
ncbi:tRNA lysidine(34) synthetase TilS [Pseudothauera nasutitermitis]|uniref:tRNA(Ile)-lysidine synthase n=1 Tax=Pseudothauera nasutitermitis TaxID=2565930 RepID=A0A4S4AQ31_9RHOO|nr:tRNA lysidine(34) synthetase TilS [Pseudothauera nasutitermitis]THF61835.1 tRNA lysidine(34) synthetase TilS [Pseudothauera nasutitermitis]